MTADRRFDTVFLDAGGVLVHPNWARVAEALARHGVVTTSAALTAAEPHAKREMDLGALMARTDDKARGWIYFESVLRHAGLPVDDAARAALADVRAYNDRHNVWEHVPEDVAPTLVRLRDMGLKLVVVSNANGLLHALFDRVGLTPLVDLALDSHHWGVEKPDPRLFDAALAESGAERTRTVHVGDFYHIDVVGARAARLADAVLFDVARLYHDADCPRIHALRELPDLVGRT